ncbi:hypothetical protein EHRUM4_08050 [Ehrlichia ruminantium]|uniref:Uncharacterized protein n=1 Tax=Ehrlichia ruminantium TaxID=779 RepID=A0A161LXB1_EHRRU|nr:hypothetical protein EHRUM4_08050 [Ehrlichia ruminantium]GAT77557.1 hypothetical protein EHRUM2_07840 [Ehrlichia ruminantium]
MFTENFIIGMLIALNIAKIEDAFADRASLSKKLHSDKYPK